MVDDYLADVAAATAEVIAHPEQAGTGAAPMYGMMAKLPMRGMVKRSVAKVMEAMYAPGVVVPDVNASAQDGVVGKVIERYGPQIDAAGFAALACSARSPAGRRPRRGPWGGFVAGAPRALPLDVPRRDRSSRSP